MHRCQAACRRGLPRRLRARRRRTTTPAASPETTPPAARPAPVSARPGPAAPAARLAGVLARCSSNASFFGVGEATGQEGGLWDGRAVDNAVLAEVVGDRLERVLLRKVERGAQVLAPRVHVRPGLDQRLDQRTPPGARRDRQRRRAVARGRVKVCPARRERLHRRHVVHFNRPVHRRAPRRRPAPAPGAPHAPGAAGLRARAVAARGSARWRVQPPVRLKVRAVRRAEGGSGEGGRGPGAACGSRRRPGRLGGARGVRPPTTSYGSILVNSGQTAVVKRGAEQGAARARGRRRPRHLGLLVLGRPVHRRLLRCRGGSEAAALETALDVRKNQAFLESKGGGRGDGRKGRGGGKLDRVLV